MLKKLRRMSSKKLASKRLLTVHVHSISIEGNDGLKNGDTLELALERGERRQAVTSVVSVSPINSIAVDASLSLPVTMYCGLDGGAFDQKQAKLVANKLTKGHKEFIGEVIFHLERFRETVKSENVSFVASKNDVPVRLVVHCSVDFIEIAEEIHEEDHSTHSIHTPSFVENSKVLGETPEGSPENPAKQTIQTTTPTESVAHPSAPDGSENLSEKCAIEEGHIDHALLQNKVNKLELSLLELTHHAVEIESKFQRKLEISANELKDQLAEQSLEIGQLRGALDNERFAMKRLQESLESRLSSEDAVVTGVKLELVRSQEINKELVGELIKQATAWHALYERQEKWQREHDLIKDPTALPRTAECSPEELGRNLVVEGADIHRQNGDGNGWPAQQLFHDDQRSVDTADALNDNVSTATSWVPDAATMCCMNKQCQRKFNRLSLWRHHCRLCGGIFCNKCSFNRVSTSSNPSSKGSLVRACFSCAEALKTAAPSGKPAEVSGNTRRAE